MPRQRSFARRRGQTTIAGFSVVGTAALLGGRRIVEAAPAADDGFSGRAPADMSANERYRFAGRADDALLDLLDDYA